jgi:hypothetical protein
LRRFERLGPSAEAGSTRPAAGSLPEATEETEEARTDETEEEEMLVADVSLPPLVLLLLLLLALEVRVERRRAWVLPLATIFSGTVSCCV